MIFFFFQAEDGIRDLVRSRGLGDVYKRQRSTCRSLDSPSSVVSGEPPNPLSAGDAVATPSSICLLYTSDAADERSSVDLGGRRIIKKKKAERHAGVAISQAKSENEIHAQETQQNKEPEE